MQLYWSHWSCSTLCWLRTFAWMICFSMWSCRAVQVTASLCFSVATSFHSLSPLNSCRDWDWAEWARWCDRWQYFFGNEENAYKVKKRAFQKGRALFNLLMAAVTLKANTVLNKSSGVPQLALSFDFAVKTLINAKKSCLNLEVKREMAEDLWVQGFTVAVHLRTTQATKETFWLI